MNREEILKCAKICVCGDREQDYGSPENNFELIGELWASYLRKKCIAPDADCCILPTDVAAMMGLFKIARIATGMARRTTGWILQGTLHVAENWKAAETNEGSRTRKCLEMRFNSRRTNGRLRG